MKRILTFVLVLVCVCTCLSFNGNDAFAKQSVTKVDAYLRDAGFPDDVIGRLSQRMKLQLYTDQCEYLAHAQEILPFAVEVDEGDVQTRNFSYLDQSITITRQYSGVPAGYTWLKIVYDWEWDYTPTLCLHDTMAIGWDSPWGGVDGESFWEYTAHGEYGGEWDYSGSSTTIGLQTDHANYDILKYHSYELITSHQGAIMSTIQHPTGSGAAQISVLGRYFHQNVSCTPSVSLSNGTISISPSLYYSAADPVRRLWNFTW